MRTQIQALLVLAIAACEPKTPGDASTTDTTSSGTSTGGVTGTWAVGSYYRPGGSLPSENLATIDVKADHTAELYAETCGSTQTGSYTVGWKPLDEDSVEFISLEPSEPLRWFGNPVFGDTVTLSRTEQANAFIVTDGETTDHAFMGEFRSKGVDERVCLVLVKPHLGCPNGAYVMPCPDS